MKPVDAHCHLDFEQFDRDRDEVIERCEEELEFVVNAGANPEHNNKVMALAEEHPDVVVPNLGLHPTYPDDFDRVEKVKQQVRENNPAAIGEIGLDYHHVTDEKAREKQEEVFVEMLELAEELAKPVVVHSRDAEKRAVELLKQYDVPVMLHCFNGTPELAKEAVESGMHVGISTQVLYSTRVQNIVKEINLENLLLETDSPFLYPEGRNEPVNVKESAEKIADLKDVEVKNVVRATSSSAEELFL